MAKLNATMCSRKPRSAVTSFLQLFDALIEVSRFNVLTTTGERDLHSHYFLHIFFLVFFFSIDLHPSLSIASKAALEATTFLNVLIDLALPFSVILQYALEKDGVIISNDQYRDWLKERPEFRNIIENR